MSGLISDDEAGRSDLGAIERRLAEKHRSQPKTTTTTASPKQSSDTPNSSLQRNDSQAGTPSLHDTSPRESVTSPGSISDKPEQIENISDMMCSLVTNGSGETRYIGKLSCLRSAADSHPGRLIVGIIDILPERHRVGQREDWRYFIPTNNTRCHQRRRQRE